ncbi:hypothetical protein C8T65DRAFT_305518 [Cerioporus squamosus]|nr:hypothetical protein C8T65DRAFT_305518 [Cerioporus squamosus]
MTINPVNQLPRGWLGHGHVPLYDTPSGRLSHMSGLPNPWDKNLPWPPPRPRGWKPSPLDPPLSVYHSIPRGPGGPEAMDVDGPPPARGPPMSRIDPAPRNGIGGMYSDRMSTSAPQEAPRAPRAMVPRDGSSYSAMPSSSTSMPNLYGARPPESSAYDGPGPSSSRSRPQLPLSAVDRRWGEASSTDRRASYSGPNPMEPPPIAPPKQVMRDLPERPMGRAPIPEPHGRGRLTGDLGLRPPARISGTNNVPIGPRTANPFEGAQPGQPSFHSTDNGYGSRRPFADERREDISDPYGKKPMRYAPANEPPPGPSRVERGIDRGSDRGGRRPSVSDTMRGPPEERQPPRGGTSPVQVCLGERVVNGLVLIYRSHAMVQPILLLRAHSRINIASGRLAMRCRPHVGRVPARRMITL